MYILLKMLENKLAVSNLCLLGMVLFISCQNGGSELAPPNTAANLELIKEIESQPNYIAVLSYQKLNSAERSLLWQRHIDAMSKVADFSQQQIAHIQKLKPVLTVETFDRVGTPELEKLMTDFEKEWFFGALEAKLFTPTQLLKISTMQGIGADNMVIKIGARQSAAQTCSCRYTISCDQGSCNDRASCSSGGTEINEENCGIAGTSRCSGSCS